MTSKDVAGALRQRIAQRSTADHVVESKQRKLAFLKEFYQPKPSRFAHFLQLTTASNKLEVSMSERGLKEETYCEAEEAARQAALAAATQLRHQQRPQATPTQATVEHG